MEQTFKFGDKIIISRLGKEIVGEFICYYPTDGDFLILYTTEDRDGYTRELKPIDRAYFDIIPVELRDNFLGKQVGYCSEDICKPYKKEPKVTPGMRCCNRFCAEFFEYVVPNVGNHFMCYRCRSEPLTYQTVLASLLG